MASKKFLAGLFETHLSNLRSIFPKIEDVFVCPICLVEYKFKDIESGVLTDGHVWPEYIRSNSRVASPQRVLLCQNCNSKAGSRGDKQMQLAEKVRDGENIGDLYGERHIEILSEKDKKSIEIRVSVREKEETTLNITGHWKRTNPKEIGRFEELVRQNQKFSFVIHPHNELKKGLPQAGWITSAYLLAFYSLGYRYILHNSLMPVREYIKQSFEIVNEEKYLELKSDDFGVLEYCEKVFFDPEIVLIVPVDYKTKVHLEINFWKYQISLPFHFVPDILSFMIFSAMPDFEEKVALLKENNDNIFFKIDCSRMGPSDEIFEYLMGRNWQPNPALT